MGLLKMFSIRDQKGEVFHSPFFKNTMGEAERDFHTSVNDEKTMLNKYPEDFDLYYMGEYDNTEGKFAPLDTPQHMTKAVSVKRTDDNAQ
jgi:hypothetical protein